MAFGLTLIRVWGGGGGGRVILTRPPTCWFSLNNSETIKAVTVTFWSIQLRFTRDIRAKFRIQNSEKRNMTTSKKINDDIMLANWDVNVFFPIYGQFAAIRKLDSGCMVYKTYIFINNNLSSYKN